MQVRPSKRLVNSVKIMKDLKGASINRSVDSGTEEQRRAVQEIIASVQKDGEKSV